MEPSLSNPQGAREGLEYLRQRGLSPLLKVLADRYRVRGRLPGQVPLEATGLDGSGLQALEALLGHRLSRRGGRLYLNVDRLDQALRRSRFATALLAVLEEGYGPLRTRADERADRDRAWTLLLDSLQRSAPGETSRAFWETVIADRHSRTLRRVRRAFLGAWRAESPRAAGEHSLADLERLLQDLSRALEALPRWRNSRERLALFATQRFGDAHALDQGRTLGQFLMHSLADLTGDRAPDPDQVGPTLHRDWLLDWAGLGRDDLSPTVLVLGTIPGAELPVALPLYTLRRLPVLLPTRGGRAYVVENPSLFGAVVDRLETNRPTPWEEGRRPSLICTSGQLNLAGFSLLDRLARQGVTLQYSGDFDLGGLRIASLALRRWPDSIRLWRMDPQSYQVALARTGGGAEFSAEERQQLQRLAWAKHGPLAPIAELAKALIRAGVRAFHEALSDELAEDVESFC